jgi:hypothetical protein
MHAHCTHCKAMHAPLVVAALSAMLHGAWADFQFADNSWTRIG